MPYSKLTTLTPFGGLASQPTADSIDDKQQSDMLNLRFTKLGYLVNRDGVRAFELETSLDPDAFGAVIRTTAIGEYILSAPVATNDVMEFKSRWGAGVTALESISQANHSFQIGEYDRYMVYGVADALNRLVYLLIPNTNIEERNPWNARWRVATGTGGDVVYFCRPTEQDGSFTLLDPPLRAAVRRISRPANSDKQWVEADGNIHDRNWIDHFQQFTQMQDKLVIADPMNGDLVIVDEWDEAEQGQEKNHRLALRENAKSLFNIDIVQTDYQLGTTEKNGAGVENGMALYKFYLKKKEAVTTSDGFNPLWSKLLKKDIGYGLGSVDGFEIAAKLSADNNFIKGFTGSFFTKENGSLGGVSKVFLVNKQVSYTFSDIKEPTEFENLLDAVSLENPDLPTTYDKDGNRVNDNAADVYVWEDFKLSYYPSSGVDINNGFLRGKDRTWGKTKPISPKIVRVTTKAGVEMDVPLGVWAYRFVWDLGNGEYTAPSAPLLVADKLWSAMKDGDISGTYERISTLKDGDEKKTNTTKVGAPGTNYTPYQNKEPRTHVFVSGVQTITPFGTLLQKVKSKLYLADHEYGGAASYDKLATHVVVHSSSSERQLEATLGEFAVMKFEADQSIPKCSVDEVKIGKLVVPLWQSAATASFNALFTAPSAGGKYRIAWTRTDPKFEFVVEGENFPATYPFKWNVDDGFSVAGNSGNVGNWTRHLDFVTTYDAKVWYNVVRDDDYNNDPVLGEPMRIETLMRITDKQTSRLLQVNSSVPTEVVDRIIATGKAELLLHTFGQKGLFRTAVQRGGFQYSTNELRQNIADANMLAPGIDTELDYISSHLERTGAESARGTAVFPGNNPEQGVIPLLSGYRGAFYVIYDDGANGSFDPEITVKPIYTFPVAVPDPGSSPATYNNWLASITYFDNTRVAIHLDGDRLLAIEQLTSYFPSSLLFGSPRVMLRIAAANIPPRAKRLMIFRTLASHDNKWQPTEFGLVDTVQVERDGSGVPTAIAYFDEKKDNDVDFNDNPNNYDGVVNQLKSRFVKPLAEKAWFANFTETYQPYAPKSFTEQNLQDVSEAAELKPLPSATYDFNALCKAMIVDDNQAAIDRGYTTFFRGKYVQYMVAFKDVGGVYSQPRQAEFMDFSVGYGTKRIAIALVLSGYPYTDGIDKYEVYRRESNDGVAWNKYAKVGEIKKEDEGVFVDTGVAARTGTWESYATDWATRGNPTMPPDVQKFEDSIAWSEPFSPGWIKYDSREGLKRGDGDPITGLEVLYGSLYVFKERSIFRVMIKPGGRDILRIDQIADKFGCIAPNTIMTYNNLTYFLSWHGLMKYDGNVFSKADGSFANELDLRLKDTNKHIPNPGIRDASCALNPSHRELYLNIPVYPAPEKPAYDYHDKGMKGHIYVIQLDTNLVTKFQYETGDPENFVPGETNDTTRGTWERTMGRLYHTDSYGRLRSGDILPKNPAVRSLLYLESPTGKHADEFQPGIDSTGTDITTPSIQTEDVQTWLRTKLFDIGDKSILKRVRKVLAYFAKGANINMGAEFNNSTYQDAAYTEAMLGDTGELEFIPPRAEGYDRGERFAVHLSSEGETELHNASITWRADNPYLT